MNRKLLGYMGFILISTIALVIGFGLYGLNDVMHPPRIIPPGTTLIEEKVNFQRVDLITKDDVRLAAWYTPSRNGAVILLAHGYGDNRPEWVYALFAKKGYGIVAWDARAHGESGGEVSTLGYREILDAKAALDFALSQEGVEHIGAWGGSMGGATLIRAAAEYPQIEALIVDSSFSSLESEVDTLAPYPVINPMAKLFLGLALGVNLDSISPAAVIDRISPRPVYIIHGMADSTAPPESAQILYDAAKEPKTLWLEEGAIHLGIHMQNPARYKRRVLGFFEVWLLGK